MPLLGRSCSCRCRNKLCNHNSGLVRFSAYNDIQGDLIVKFILDFVIGIFRLL